jgi:predicted nucleic acid-binding protein
VIVLDAPAAVEWLLQTPVGLRVQERVRLAYGDLHAPYLFDIEVTQTLRNLVRAQKITPSKGAAALEDLADLRCYCGVSRVPLVTCNAKIASAPCRHARVELITEQN